MAHARQRRRHLLRASGAGVSAMAAGPNAMNALVEESARRSQPGSVPFLREYQKSFCIRPGNHLRRPACGLGCRARCDPPGDAPFLCTGTAHPPAGTKARNPCGAPARSCDGLRYARRREYYYC